MPQRARARAALAVVALCLAAVASCRSSSTSVTAPTDPKCSVTLSYTGGVLPAAGGSASIGVTTGRECTWTASTGVAWLTVGTASGQGPGSVPVTFAENTTTSQRQAQLTVGGQPLLLMQAAAPCRYTLTPASATVGPGTGTIPVSVDTQSGCAWTAVANDPWLSVAPAGGSGNGAVSVAAQANAGPGRTGTVSIASQTFIVTQAATAPAACTYALSPTSRTIDAGGGSGSVSLAAASGCAWTATSTASWIRITGPSSGTGAATIGYSVDANAGASRRGTIAVAGQVFTISQESGAPACTYSVSPGSRSFDQPGGSATVTVSAPAGCEWSSSSGAAWIRITGEASGRGDGTVNFSVDPNTGPSRAGTLTVAGQPVQVMQGGCTFSIAPESATVPGTGGAGSVAVTAPAGCAWTAGSHDAWIAITSGASGAGAGTVSFTVAPNTAGARSGTLTVAGLRFTVSQAAAPVTCTVAIAPTTQSAPTGGGTFGTDVTSPAGCAWTAAANAAWLLIVSGQSGNGAGRVTYEVQPNGSTMTRTGTLTIGGQTLTVSQAGATCTYSVAPGTVTVPAGGGNASIAVTAPAGCAWGAQSGAAWIEITSGTTGSGDGTVAILVRQNNTGAARTGQVTVQGVVVTVNQSS